MMAHFDLKDVRIDTFTGGGRVLVRVTHLPTGISKSAEGESQIRVRDEVLKELEAAVLAERSKG